QPLIAFVADARAGRANEIVRLRMPERLDVASIAVEQTTYPSKDGTEVTMFLVHRKDVAPTGQVPTLLSGYGGFNISRVPASAAGALRRGLLRGAAARHAPLSELPHRPHLDRRVRLRRGSPASGVASQVLAVPQHARRCALSAGAVHDRGGGQPRRPDARPKDGRAPAGAKRGPRVPGPLAGRPRCRSWNRQAAR